MRRILVIGHILADAIGPVKSREAKDGEGNTNSSCVKINALVSLCLRTLTYKLELLHCIVVAHYVLIKLPHCVHLLLLIRLDTRVCKSEITFT